MGNAYSQQFPPAPSLTEENLPDQAGKVRYMKPPFPEFC